MLRQYQETLLSDYVPKFASGTRDFPNSLGSVLQSDFSANCSMPRIFRREKQQTALWDLRGASVPSQLGSETEAEGCGSDGPSSFQQASAMDCHPCRPCSPAEHTPAPLPPPLLPPPLAAWGVCTVGTQGTQILNWYDEKGDLLNQCRFSRQRESAK